MHTYLHALQVHQQLAQQLSADLAANQQLALLIQAVLMGHHHRRQLAGDAVQVLCVCVGGGGVVEEHTVLKGLQRQGLQD